MTTGGLGLRLLCCAIVVGASSNACSWRRPNLVIGAQLPVDVLPSKKLVSGIGPVLGLRFDPSSTVAIDLLVPLTVLSSSDGSVLQFNPGLKLSFGGAFRLVTGIGYEAREQRWLDADGREHFQGSHRFDLPIGVGWRIPAGPAEADVEFRMMLGRTGYDSNSGWDGRWAPELQLLVPLGGK